MIAANSRIFSRPRARRSTAEFPPQSEILDTRITNPGVGAISGLKAASAETLRRSREARDARREKELTPDQKIWVANNVTLRGYYQHFLEPERRKRLARGKITANTLQKDRQSLNRWERHTRPDDWPARKRWEGLVIGAIDEEDLADFFLRSRSQPLSSETVRSTWNHLRVIFNHAWHRGVLTDHLTPEAIERETGVVTIYSDAQIEAAYRAFNDRVDLQVAFVLAICCGPRTGDVFGLRWDGVDLLARSGPVLRFTARKTGKEHAIPLPEVAVKHIGRLLRAGEYLFEGLCEPDNAHPERSVAARERNADIKARLVSAGIHFEKPFQAARATCNETLESHHQGLGQFVLGHALTLNSKSYREPSKMLREKLATAPLPDCFWEF